MIPLTDIAISPTVKAQILKKLTNVINSKRYILGPELERFEESFSKYIGVFQAIGVANGTDALRLSLLCLGVGPRDKVLTVAFTSPFTVLAIIQTGAKPVFCDVDESTWTMDVSDAAKKIDRKTKAIIPVHLFGNPADMDSILRLARISDTYVVEDACQAHGAQIGDRMAGSWGSTAAFSFYPTKNLGAFGDAGMITTNNAKLADYLKLTRHGGQTKRFWHEYAGVNSRLDEIQAAILNVKFKFMKNENKKRLRLSERYIKYLSDLPITFQQSIVEGLSSNHLFVIRTEKRDGLMKFLIRNGIFCDVYYPYSIDKQAAFAKFRDGTLSVTQKLTAELLAIPLYPSLSLKKQDFIIEKIRKFFRHHLSASS